MKLRCKRGNSFLTKGVEYDILLLDTTNKRNTNGNYNYRKDEVIVSLNKSKKYATSAFEHLDGTPISPDEYYIDEDFKHERDIINDTNIYQSEDLKIGDIIKCKHSNTKNLTVGALYEVSNINYSRYTNQHGNRYPSHVKVKVISRWISAYKFRTLTKQEKRDMSLDEVFTGEKKDYTHDGVSKWKKMDPKDAELLKLRLLVSCITSSDRHTDLKTWVNKIGEKFEMSYEDVKPYLSISLEELLSKFPHNE